jgi:hypothetical protein
MKAQKITSELVIAYWQCPRKAFFLVNKSQQPVPHELISFVNKRRDEDWRWYLKQMQDMFGDVHM